MKTTVSFIADIKDKDGMRNYPPYVTSYSSQGFNIKGIKVFGSVALLPTIFYHWRVSSLCVSVIIILSMIIGNNV